MAKVSTPTMTKMDRQYREEGDHRTMLQAAEIQGDSSRMTGVKRHQRKQVKALSLMQRTMLKGGR
jgi:hypothetical protein